jgi:tetratricopeptide (TPR) repeat protein
MAGGADPNLRAKTGLTALMQAAFTGQTAIVRILLEARPDVDARLDNQSTALMAAALGGHTEIVRALIAAGADIQLTADNGSTALMEAAHAGRMDAVRVLLDAGSNVNAALDNGITALMGAALGGHTAIVHALIAAGANVSARDRNGWTALTHAAASASLDAVQALLASGIEVDPKERSLVVGRTYVNEYYSSNERRLLDLAATEFQKVLYSDPDNLTALEWTGAVEVLRWDENLNLQQFRRAIALLKRCVGLDKDQPERYYWIAAANSIFVATGKGASANEYAALLDEGIANALKAIELNPRYWEAMSYLNVLYRQRAERLPAGATRDQLLRLATTTAENAIKARDANNGRPSRPNDQFTTPAPPPPPAL